MKLNKFVVEKLSYRFFPLPSINIVDRDTDGYSLINDEAEIIHKISVWPTEIIFRYRIIDNKVLLYEAIQRDLATGCAYVFKWDSNNCFYCDQAEGFDRKCMMFKSWGEYFGIKEVKEYIISKGGKFNDN